MCGITGIVSSDSKNNINEAVKLMKHRGPDDSGIWQDKTIALGHRRLSIQDLSANGHQPMFSADERYVMIFNGEIYNHLDIRDELRGKYKFKSTSDTETILYGYVEFGTELFNKMNGIFALAIYDTQTNDLVLVRDQFGVKPLYWYQDSNKFLFGSEIKSFLGYGEGITQEINPKAIANYLNFLWSPGEATPFKDVNKLLPGHYLKLNTTSPTNLETVKYYEIPFDGNYSQKTEEKLIDELDEKLMTAVKRQLLSDVPVGFFLSGGLDSSLVVAMAKKINPDKKICCYTIESDIEDIKDEGFSNDLDYAKKVAIHLDVDLKIVKGSIDIMSDFDKLIYHLDEPQADPAPINVLNICRQARQDGYVVLLGGTAGDDLFSGYRKHIALNFEPYINATPAPLARLLYNFSCKLNVQNSTVRRAQKILRNADKKQEDRLVAYFSWIPRERLEKLFTKKIRNGLEGYFPTDYLKESLKNIPKEKNNLNKLLFLDMKYFLADHNLNYTDKAAMAVGVEVRVPYLDKDLVEFSTKLPVDLKMKGKTVKYILKKVAERYLPHDVIYRPKAGFGAPVRKWIIRDLDPMIQERLSKKEIEKYGFFNPNEVHKLIEDNKQGKVDASYTIWCLLAIQSWMQQFASQN